MYGDEFKNVKTNESIHHIDENCIRPRATLNDKQQKCEDVEQFQVKNHQ